MSFTVHVSKAINGAEVSFSTQITTLEEALKIAQQLAGAETSVAVTAETKTTKKSSDAGSASTAQSSQASAPIQERSSGEAKPENAKPITYDDVKEAILSISAKNREHAVALLARHGAKSGKDLKESQFTSFHADALRVIAGEYDPREATDD